MGFMKEQSDVDQQNSRRKHSSGREENVELPMLGGGRHNIWCPVYTLWLRHHLSSITVSKTRCGSLGRCIFTVVTGWWFVGGPLRLLVAQSAQLPCSNQTRSRLTWRISSFTFCQSNHRVSRWRGEDQIFSFVVVALLSKAGRLELSYFTSHKAETHSRGAWYAAMSLRYDWPLVASIRLANKVSTYLTSRHTPVPPPANQV